MEYYLAIRKNEITPFALTFLWTDLEMIILKLCTSPFPCLLK